MKPSEIPGPTRTAVLKARVLNEIAHERQRAEEKFPDQHLPFGTGTPADTAAAEMAKAATDTAARVGDLTWRHVIEEEYREAMAESDPRRLHDELVQLAAMAMRAAEDALIALDEALW